MTISFRIPTMSLSGLMCFDRQRIERYLRQIGLCLFHAPHRQSTRQKVFDVLSNVNMKEEEHGRQGNRSHYMELGGWQEQNGFPR